LALSQPDQPAPQRLIKFTPLRYPGGKGRLAAYIKRLMSANRLLDGEYVEPFAGGAAIGLELLFHEYVSRIHINDISRPVYSFWKAVLNHTDELCKLVVDTPLTVKSWDKQKRIFANFRAHDDLTLGFATFFLNRTNRSGILNGGIIGGRDQTGPWKIDARYNARELAFRITSIARMKNRIRLTHKDALRFLESGVSKWPDKTLIYLDPPYYLKGRGLYYDFYEPEDHESVASFVRSAIKRQRWIVSYDNESAIRKLYVGSPHIVYDIGYSARSSRQGSEVMYFSDKLKIPSLVGSVALTEEYGTARNRRSA
jgi:DNA adenine methylase